MSRSALATLSLTSTGALRSISTLPVMRRMPCASAAVKRASTEALCTVGKTTAAVVPCAIRASRKSAAALAAWAGSAWRASAGKVWVVSQSSSSVP